MITKRNRLNHISCRQTNTEKTKNHSRIKNCLTYQQYRVGLDQNHVKPHRRIHVLPKMMTIRQLIIRHAQNETGSKTHHRLDERRRLARRLRVRHPVTIKQNKSEEKDLNPQHKTNKKINPIQNHRLLSNNHSKNCVIGTAPRPAPKMIQNHSSEHKWNGGRKII